MNDTRNQLNTTNENILKVLNYFNEEDDLQETLDCLERMFDVIKNNNLNISADAIVVLLNKLNKFSTKFNTNAKQEKDTLHRILTTYTNSISVAIMYRHNLSTEQKPSFQKDSLNLILQAGELAEEQNCLQQAFDYYVRCYYISQNQSDIQKLTKYLNRLEIIIEHTIVHDTLIVELSNSENAYLFFKNTIYLIFKRLLYIKDITRVKELLKALNRTKALHDSPQWANEYLSINNQIKENNVTDVSIYWQKYRSKLFKFRKQAEEDFAKLKILNKSRQLINLPIDQHPTYALIKKLNMAFKYLINIIWEDCIKTLGKMIDCPLALSTMGSLAHCTTLFYSDIECLLLQQENDNRYSLYIKTFLKLFKFKIRSIGETGHPNGFRLDEQSDPEALTYTPTSLICALKLENFQTNQTCSLIKPLYSCGNKTLFENCYAKLYEIYQTPNKEESLTTIQQLSLNQLIKDIDKVTTLQKRVPIVEVIDLKKRIWCPLIHLVMDLESLFCETKESTDFWQAVDHLCIQDKITQNEGNIIKQLFIDLCLIRLDEQSYYGEQKEKEEVQLPNAEKAILKDIFSLDNWNEQGNWAYQRLLAIEWIILRPNYTLLKHKLNNIDLTTFSNSYFEKISLKDAAYHNFNELINEYKPDSIGTLNSEINNQHNKRCLVVCSSHIRVSTYTGQILLALLFCIT